MHSISHGLLNVCYFSARTKIIEAHDFRGRVNKHLHPSVVHVKKKSIKFPESIFHEDERADRHFLFAGGSGIMVNKIRRI